MAIQRTINITLNFKDGTTLDLSGDTAQRVLQEYEAHVRGGINNALKFTNADGNTQYIEFECLCGLTQLPTTETEVDDIACADFNCIEPVEV